MKLLKNVKPTDMVICNSIWSDLLDTNFSNNDAIKLFDSLISKSDNSEKIFRYFTYLILYQTSFDKDKAVNFIKQKIKERLSFINEELKRVKMANAEANEVVMDLEKTEETFYKKGEALKQKFNELPAEFVLVFKHFGKSISEQDAKKYIDNLEQLSFENFVKPFLFVNIELLSLVNNQNFEMNVLQKFYEKLDSILIARVEYKKEKIKREKDYKEAIKGCANYEIQCDKLISEKEMLGELLNFLNEKINNNSLQSNVDKVIENVKTWFNNPNVDSSIKNQIRFFGNFQVDFMINNDEQIVIKELLFDNTIKTSIISFENQEDYLLCKSLVERIRGSIIKKDDLDSYIEYLDKEHTYDYIKETLICLILHVFFVEEHKNIDFVDDSRPEFIDVKLREMVSRANSQTPSYVRSLQLLNTKAN